VATRAKRWRDPRGLLLAAVVGAALTSACHDTPNGTVVALFEARAGAANLRLQFNRASESSDRAVLAATDDASVTFAREAEQGKQAVRQALPVLESHLKTLGYAPELEALARFKTKFAEYEQLDRDILALAVENTNIKALQLSFGPAKAAGDAFKAALEKAATSAPPKRRCELRALVDQAVIALRELELLQPPHIAASADTAMNHLEEEMAALMGKARQAVDAVFAAVDEKNRPPVAEARAALDRFDALSRELVKLSRRNTNVRSLELSLSRKPLVANACDEILRLLQEAIEQESFSGTR
jgi:hypothetical protein